jgi:hypothetical protein
METPILVKIIVNEEEKYSFLVPKAVLGIRDPWCGSGSADPYL